MKNKKGFTIVELMIAIVLIGIGILGLVESFKFINLTIQASKNKTIASNLAQEKMQIIKEKKYYNIVPTKNPSYLTDFTPAIAYDNTFFLPEEILEAGVYYKRYVYIEVVKEDSGNIIVLPPETPDTGMRRINIAIVWNERGKKKIELKSIISNPNTPMANSVITGVVKDTMTFLPIADALVKFSENTSYRDITDNNGAYTIESLPGNYTINVSTKGYNSIFESISIAANATQTRNFFIQKISTGMITGYPWLRDHLVISQIVGSTISSSGFDQEYIEVFNPTTYTWVMNGNIGLKYQRIYDSYKKDIKINYLNSNIPSNSFYLFANTGTIVAAGKIINADAIWDPSNSLIDFPDFLDQNNIIRIFEEGGDEGGGAIELYRISDSKILDQVGWNRTDGASSKQIAPFYENNPIPQSIGLQRKEQYVRKSSTNGVSVSYGPSYDSNNNDKDFYDYTADIVIAPENSSHSLPIISATPASGALISCSDGVSISTIAYLTGNPPYAYFNLLNVATGTWSVMMSSLNYSLINDTVVINNGDNYIFSSTCTFLDTELLNSYITGKVLDNIGNPINPEIKVTDGVSEVSASNSDGKYIIYVGTGYLNITANPNNLNSYYISVSSNNIFIDSGQIKTGVDFILYPGSRISGFITRDGVNPLPGITVIISNIYYGAADSQISDVNGYFLSNNLSTGTYIIEPVIDLKEKVSPSSTTVSMSTAGNIYFSSTFTVSNAMGYIKGSVSYNTLPIKTGSLIVVTTTTISGSLPEINSGSLSGPPYYMGSSNEEGKFNIEVRQSTSPAYNVYVYYSLDNGTILSASQSNVQVLAGQEVTGVNFSW